MRINLLTGGFGGTIGALQNDVDRLYSNIEFTIEDLKDLKKKINNVSGGTGGLEAAVTGISNRIRTEETKKTNLETIAGQINTFLNNATQTDSTVSQTVRENQNQFFNDFPWLRPQNTNTEPSIWEQLAEAWGDFWSDAGEWLSDLVSNIVEYLKEYGLKLIIGLIGIVIAAVLIGEAFVVTFLALLAATILEATISGIISGLIALSQGESFWEAFGEEFANSFMWGGIFAAISGIVVAIRKAIKGFKYADNVASVADNVVDDIADGADDVAEKVSGQFDEILDGANKIEPGSVDIPENVPEWRKAELRELNKNGGYDQLSFQDGKTVPRGTEGSTRPDVIREIDGHLEAVEVKYYDLSKSANRNELYKELLREVTERCTHLPPDSTQRIVLDVTGRGFDEDTVYKVVDHIRELLEDVYPDIPIDVVGLS